MRSHRTGRLAMGGAVVAVLALTVTVHTQRRGGEERVALEGGETGALRLPDSRRPPVMLLALGDPTGARALAEALAAEGVASLLDADLPSTEDGQFARLVAWTTWLRNDARFRVVSVMADAGSAVAAAQAVRAARADSLLIAGGSRPASVPLSVPVQDHVAAADAAGIAAFLRDVAPLGLGGNRRRERPDTPRLSPRITRFWDVGDARITIEYGQPGRRGRALWGTLVRWRRVWMPGADEATTLTTTGTVVFDGTLTVPPGDYTIYTLPTADRFTLIVSHETGQFHTVYHANQDLGRVEMTMAARPDDTELLTFMVEGGAAGRYLFKLVWGEREYAVPFTVETSGR